MRFKYLLLVLLAMPCLSMASSRDTVTWSNNRLSSEDFRMKMVSDEFARSLKMDSRTTLEGYIFSGIHFSYERVGNNMLCEVKAYMIPSESWLRDNEDDATLEHEQAHFDITEIYARRLRRDLSKVKTPEAAKKLMQVRFEAMQAEQRRFDKSHKNECGVHPLWQVKINEELEELSEWAAPQVMAELQSAAK